MACVYYAAALCLTTGACSINDATARRARGSRTTTVTRNNAQRLSELIVNRGRRNNNRGQPQQQPRTPSAGSRAVQQTLSCEFSSVTAAQEIRFTATGSTVGTWVNTATVLANDNTQSDDATVTVVSVKHAGCADGLHRCGSTSTSTLACLTARVLVSCLALWLTCRLACLS
jgi:hypothetical protein